MSDPSEKRIKTAEFHRKRHSYFRICEELFTVFKLLLFNCESEMAFLNKSEYLQKLERETTDVAVRYKDKIRVIKCIDPFSLTADEKSTVLEDFPTVTSFDIITYLVLTHSFYSNTQMKAYKSLAAYKYFESGFVHDCEAKQIGDHVVVLGKVKHSQRMNEPSLQVWVICQLDGAINSAHCTCMAGLSEVCSHVAALLYAVEYIKKSQSDISCTDVKAKWITPALTKVPIIKLSDMHLKPSVEATSSKLAPSKITPALKGTELEAFLKSIQDSGDDAALLRIVEPFATEISKTYPIPLPNLYKIYKNEFEVLPYKDLCSMALELDETLTNEERKSIQMATLKQNKSTEWFNQRAGRITGSNFKRVCCTSLVKPSLSLLKTVCYPLECQFKSKATEWGLRSESKAAEEYKTQMSSHGNLKLERVGLCIDQEHPFLAASPDLLVSCDCCGKGCVEIKCPYILKNLDLAEYLVNKNSCLRLENEEVKIKHNHAYYYQIQLQLRVTKLDYCDFVVWSPKDLFIQRIFFDEDFWAVNFIKANNFHKQVILPELLGKYFTKSKHLDQQWCLCGSVNDDRPMIQCENDSCETQWFHIECVGLSEIPQNLWSCQQCTNSSI